MTITREQVADLREGDVVELRRDDWPDTITRGPLRTSDGSLEIADMIVRWADGSLPTWVGRGHLTVISRAPRPLYVNHPRTQPVPGDVVRDADSEARAQIWVCGEEPPGDRFEYPEARSWLRWNAGNGRWTYFPQSDLPASLRLLVNGETGQVVR